MTKVLLGTTKGVFVLSDKGDDTWNFSGPHCTNWPVNHVVGEGDNLWACGGNAFWGAAVLRSTDGGENWTFKRLSGGEIDDWLVKEPELADMFGLPKDEVLPFNGQIDALWSLKRVGGKLYCGAKPAMLFMSEDDGETWEKVNGLTDQEGAENWQPGGAGLTLHTILADPAAPEKLWVGISAAGVFATEDGGKTWDRRNRKSNEDDKEVGHCVHNIARASTDGDLLYQQNHHGVWRSYDGGRSWQSISEGLPSDFGFPIAVSPIDPQTIFVLPLNGDTRGRFPPDASAAVYVSKDGGDSWTKTQNGLPTENCYFTVLRQAMATDAKGGMYFGTNSGSVFMTRNDGESYEEIAQHLPTLLSVEVLND